MKNQTLVPSEQKALGTTMQMLSLLTSVGMGKEFVLPLLEMGGQKLFSKEQRRYFLGPIVQHQSLWIETTPKWMYEAIASERLQIIQNEIESGETEGRKVGPIELMTCIYPATLEAPMRHEYAQLYLWAGSHAVPYHTKGTAEEFWQNVGGTPVGDEEVCSPGGRYHYDYQKLCSDIRHRVVKVRIERERAQKKSDNTKKVKDDGIAIEQLSLF